MRTLRVPLILLFLALYAFNVGNHAVEAGILKTLYTAWTTSWDRGDFLNDNDVPDVVEKLGLNPISPGGFKKFLESIQPEDKKRLKEELGLVYDHIPEESMKLLNQSLIDRQNFPPLSGDPIPRYVDWLFGVVILIIVLSLGAATSPFYYLPSSLDSTWNNLINNILGQLGISGRQMTGLGIFEPNNHLSEPEARALNRLERSISIDAWLGGIRDRLVTPEDCSDRISCETATIFRSTSPVSKWGLRLLQWLAPSSISYFAGSVRKHMDADVYGDCNYLSCRWIERTFKMFGIGQNGRKTRKESKMSPPHEQPLLDKQASSE